MVFVMCVEFSKKLSSETMLHYSLVLIETQRKQSKNTG